MDKCPHCGCDEYYRRVVFSGIGRYSRRFDGAAADNTELHTPLNYKEQQMMYCCDCHEPLGTITKNNIKESL